MPVAPPALQMPRAQTPLRLQCGSENSEPRARDCASPSIAVRTKVRPRSSDDDGTCAWRPWRGMIVDTVRNRSEMLTGAVHPFSRGPHVRALTGCDVAYSGRVSSGSVGRRCGASSSHEISGHKTAPTALSPKYIQPGHVPPTHMRIASEA